MPDIYINPDSKPKEEEPEESPKKEKVPKKGGSKKTENKQEASGKTDHKRKGHSHRPFASYSYCPDKVSFESIENGEKIILFLRQHPIVNFKWMLVAILMALAPLLLTVFPLLEPLPPNFKVVALMGWYLLVFAYVIEGFYRWFFNIYILTNRRIVDIDFFNLIYKQVSSSGLGKVQDVTYRVGGAIRTTLNYGDVFVQTAAEVPTIDFLAVPNPREVVGIIRDTMDDFKKSIVNKK